MPAACTDRRTQSQCAAAQPRPGPQIGPRTDDRRAVGVVAAAVARRLAQVELAHGAVLAARDKVVCRRPRLSRLA